MALMNKQSRNQVYTLIATLRQQQFDLNVQINAIEEQIKAASRTLDLLLTEEPQGKLNDA